MFKKMKLIFAYPEKKWYLQTWFICLSLLFFFPIGIILLIFHYRNNYLRNLQNNPIEYENSEKSLNNILKSIEDGQNKMEELNKKIQEFEEQKNTLESQCLEYNKYITEYNEDSKKFSQTITKINEMRKEKSDLDAYIYDAELKKKELEENITILEQIKNNKAVEIALLNEDIEDLKYKQEVLEETLVNTDIDFDSLEFVDKIKDGIKFEEYVAKMLRKLKYTEVETTPPSGDYGIDVLATDKDDVTWGFQCKLYSNTVGVDAIQQALTGKTHYHCAIVAVITNNYFTNEAKNMAKENNVQLWDRDKLARKLQEAKKVIKINI